MSLGEPKTLQTVKSFLERQKLEYEESEEHYCTKLTVKNGPQTVPLSVFNTGKIFIGGKNSPLKHTLQQMKTAIEQGQATPGQTLPFEIEKFPETIREKVPECDPVIVRFVEEAIICWKSEAYLACAFMLGAASERATNLLIQTYGESITDQTNREKFFSKVNNRMISVRFDEFRKSYAGCKSKPTAAVLSQDLDTVIGTIFHFCRITRNEVGHPQIVPDLDKGVLLANLGQFVTYIGRIYGLMQHFKANGVVL